MISFGPISCFSGAAAAQEEKAKKALPFAKKPKPGNSVVQGRPLGYQKLV